MFLIFERKNQLEKTGSEISSTHFAGLRLIAGYSVNA
jgi:hypothetical protein